MKHLWLALVLAGLVTASAPAHAQNFYAIKDSDCLTNVGSLFTVGGQYVDPNNGVLPNSWSMLVRWQGSTIVQNPVSYDMGAFTGITVPAPRTTWQRGFQPEDAQGTPGAQLHCHDAGMLINTWSTPHIKTVGGSYNDMYGYSWSTANRPRAFVHTFSVYPVTYNVPSELVIQANIKVPFVGVWAGTPHINPTTWTSYTGSSQITYGSVQNDLFVYLADTTHPNLHPIAVLAGTMLNQSASCRVAGSPVAQDYPGGVWFGGSIMCTNDIMTLRTGAQTAFAPFSDSRLFRIHITRDNMVNLVNLINANGCKPANCYSTNPDDYVVNYAGVISEAALIAPDDHGVVGVNNDALDRQVSMATGIQNVGIFWYHP